MNKVDLYKDYMKPEAHQKLRKQLFKVWHADPCSIMEYARRVGINYASLRRFMVEEKKLTNISIYKIINFLEKKGEIVD